MHLKNLRYPPVACLTPDHRAGQYQNDFTKPTKKQNHLVATHRGPIKRKGGLSIKKPGSVTA